MVTEVVCLVAMVCLTQFPAQTAVVQKKGLLIAEWTLILTTVQLKRMLLHFVRVGYIVFTMIPGKHSFKCLLDTGIDTEFSNCTDGDIRLEGGGNPLEGRVEVCINRAWGTICDNGFSDEDATVVCNLLKFPYQSKCIIISSEQIFTELQCITPNKVQFQYQILDLDLELDQSFGIGYHVLVVKPIS